MGKIIFRGDRVRYLKDINGEILQNQWVVINGLNGIGQLNRFGQTANRGSRNRPDMMHLQLNQ